MTSIENRPTPSALMKHSAVGLLCLIWGSTWLVIREGLQDLPAFTSAGMRFSVAALMMIALAPVLRPREGGTKPPLWLWVSSGVLNFAFSYGIVYWCERTLPSGLVSLLWAVFPMFMAVSGHWFLPGERLRVQQWLGFLIGFGGMAVLFRTDLQGFGPEAMLTGVVLLLSPLASCVGLTLIKRYGEACSSVLLNRNGMTLAAILLMGTGLVVEHGADIHWTTRAVLSVTYLSLVGTVATFGLFFWLMRFAAAHRLSLVAYVTPGLALLLGWTVGEEPISRYTLVGAALILFGVMLVVQPAVKKKAGVTE